MRQATSYMSVDPLAPIRKTMNDGQDKAAKAARRLVGQVIASSTEDQEWEARFQQRERQIELTKAAPGYQSYSKRIRKESRGPNDPQTPSAREMCSKRQFDGKLLKWRKSLRQFDDSSMSSSPL